jgi:hypothetical protein
VGLRDRALIGAMIYTFARIGAVLRMKVSDYFIQGRRGWVRLHEKGGKEHQVPCPHNLEKYLDEYIAAAGIADEPDGPLFRTTGRKTRPAHPPHQQETYRMIQRRAKGAGIKTSIGCHTFRATGITASMKEERPHVGVPGRACGWRDKIVLNAGEVSRVHPHCLGQSAEAIARMLSQETQLHADGLRGAQLGFETRALVHVAHPLLYNSIQHQSTASGRTGGASWCYGCREVYNSVRRTLRKPTRVWTGRAEGSVVGNTLVTAGLIV